MASKRIVIACGGTGGHLFPGIAVGEVLRARGHEVMLIISEKAIDKTATAGRERDFRIVTQAAVGLPSPLLSPRLLRFLTGALHSVQASRALFREFQPAAVLGMGGFTSTGPILAARTQRLPCFVHESNAIPGKANRLNARLTGLALLGLADCARHFEPKVRTLVTGTPVRASLCAPVDRAAALTRFGFSEAGPEVKTLLVMGGSQGARGVNEALLAALPALRHEAPRLRLIHQTGTPENERFQAAAAEAGIPAYVAAFLDQMQDAYALADLAICRSGAASLTEVAHFGLPSILIPYPHAAEDHQTLNANVFVQAGAAHLLKESGSTDYLAPLVLELLRTPARLAALKAGALSLDRPAAAEAVADAVLGSAR
ncbi:MAG: UDP-N-acetylglucosamine--N-acetylmuramyl-(pentapeptide) pyrophosphoryl-undecaprenol N-acetylglucosamine transferase [Verrucomicrobia bacterium]|nr:UDP-N-acetylglucosamine--N-acetylmuramyl-(pentapeptide) pyrophosphoryl-undecaprenol N-acetylglucosamine transferase [Verrucomicrobiota bacterium]